MRAVIFFCRLLVAACVCSSALADTVTWFSPEQDTQSALIAFVNGARKELLVADYSFVCPPLTDALIARHRAGVDVSLVLDRTQAAGRAEKAELLRLRAAGVTYLVGTSSKHRIMHHKFMVRDAASVLSGSYNFTSSAALENNFFDIVTDAGRARRFAAEWLGIRDFMKGQAQP